ncbi:hypothetical protein AB0C76_33095 [Kitasatospora sp. NPDC048722]|uniref:hypothetical protein n=1 Tax=Kitasatospora sp. NPDC048722 TaxID=3155639 RepID=UPI003400FF9F
MARLHAGLRLNTAAWEGVELFPSNDRMRRIIDELGPAGLGRAVTIHEAGHAVVGLATGHRITGMSLTGNGLNHAQTSYDGARGLLVVEHLAMITAGIQAELRWLDAIDASRLARDYAQRQAATDMDDLRRTAEAEGVHADTALRDARDCADRLLSRHWRAVEAVAYELDLRNSLGEPEVRRLAGI